MDRQAQQPDRGGADLITMRSRDTSGPRPSRLAIVGVRLVGSLVLCLATLFVIEQGLRTRREWVASHLVVTPTEDDRFVADRLLRYRNKPSYRYGSDPSVPDRVVYTNNSLGLRGPEIAPPTSPRTPRVVLVGGSTVYGALVDDTQTISVHLQAALREALGTEVDVINGGVPGYEALREMVFARADLFALQPDVVIALDGLNDVFYGSLEEWPSQIAADQIGILSDRRFPDVVSTVDATMFPHGLIEHQVTMLGRIMRPFAHRLIGEKPPAPPRIVNDRVIALHAASMGLLARNAHATHACAIAALQPLVATGHKPLSDDEKKAVDYEGYWSVGNWPEIALSAYPRLAQTTAEAMASESGSFVDLSGAFDAETGTTYAQDAVHYTPLGNLRLAETLAPLVTDCLATAGRNKR